MTAAAPVRIRHEEYLDLERRSDGLRHEWSDGVVYAMSRSTPEHARLTMRIGAALLAALRGECEVFSPDAMLYVEAARLSTYADASVVCGPLETKTVRKEGRSLGEAITNPVVTVEVLSEATERYDRDGKVQAYKRIPALREYVLISQEPQRIEGYRRDEGDKWTCETADAGGAVTIHGARILVDDVYL